MAHQMPSGSSAGAPSNTPGSDDWPAQVTAMLVRTVDQVRSKTTRPATVAARGLVYGLIAALVGILIATLVFIGLFRAVDRARNLIVEDAVWLTYFFLGALFVVVGAVVFARRKPRS